jgi:hypothetical protein
MLYLVRGARSQSICLKTMDRCPMPDNPNSVIRRVNYKARETQTLVCEADTFAAYHSPEGFMVLELTRSDSKGRPIEGWRFELCSEDADRVVIDRTDWKRRRAR